jgi:hypothetical protein
VTRAPNKARRAAQRAKLIAARPRKLDIIFPWARLGVFEDISFAATPGPGYSEGGDVFSPARDKASERTRLPSPR